IARTAIDHGAVVGSYVSAERIVRHPDGSVAGLDVRARFCDDVETFRLRARLVINAAGVWCDEVRRTGDEVDIDTIRPAKGVHVTIPWSKVRNEIAVVIPVPKDRRSLFVIPWGPRPEGGYTHTYVGTTDTDYRGPLDDPQCTKDDIDYVVGAINANLDAGVTADDITGVWAGLRPLVKQVNAEDGSGRSGKAARTADLSRRHLVLAIDDGLITVTGGKLTTYREMAEDAVDMAVRHLRRLDPSVRPGRCRTRSLRLFGAPRRGFRVGDAPGSRRSHLFSRYGTESAVVESMIAADPALGEPLSPGLPYLRAEVVFAVRYEMAVTLEDVLSRRTRALLFDRAAAARIAPEVARLMAPLLDWNAARTESEIAAFRDLCSHEEAAASVLASELHPT
ncbi:MAG: glycerol-3-phosphate dehydrogenase/oxidase, partial [Actinomycetota bacterium]